VIEPLIAETEIDDTGLVGEMSWENWAPRRNILGEMSWQKCPERNVQGEMSREYSCARKIFLGGDFSQDFPPRSTTLPGNILS
jgi:hypothetical protein